MFALAILIGIYSYLVMALGFAGFLYKPVLVSISLIYLFAIIFFHKLWLKTSFFRCLEILKKIQKQKIFFFLFILLFLQALINFSALAFNGEILAKLIHFSFGILTCVALYKVSREFFSSKASLIGVVIFYSNLVVGWQSITAYVDLARTFFELLALWGFIKLYKSGEKKWLVESAVMLGLAISTKLLALGSLLIFSLLIIFYFLHVKKNLNNLFIGLFVYWSICLLVPLPWFVFSYINTGSPIFPFFTDLYRFNLDISLINPIKFIVDIWDVFTKSSDPVSPIYIIFLPLILFFFKKSKFDLKVIYIYSIIAIVIWYLTPRTGGGRFILPYLPALSILCVSVLEKTKGKILGITLIGLVIIVSIVSIVYRGIANFKYLPVVIGKQTRADFLSLNLNFSFGDFYDTDGYSKNTIKTTDKVLLYGFHNLYYVNFPFVDSSWVKKGDTFNYIAVQEADLPERFWDWDLIYHNQKTKVNLYSKGGIMWHY